MTDKELIKQEIERQKSFYKKTFDVLHPDDLDATIAYAHIELLGRLLDFIDSLPEQPISENLEDAAYHFCMDEYGNPKESLFEFDQRCFIAGAEWQKQQMMKNVVLETEVLMDCDGDGIETPYEEWLTLEDTEIPCVPDSFKNGDIVKVVLIKEDLP